jgi:hypothetical protein
MEALLWLCQGGRNARKHHQWLHPFFVYILHYAVVVSTAFCVHDLLINQSTDCRSSPSQKRCALVMGCYAALQTLARVVHMPPVYRQCVLYEACWLCNSTLVVGSLGLYFHRPGIALAFCVTVGIDQLLWYLDLMTWAVFDTFVVGVAKYLSWPETPWVTRLTCTHHLWTIPLFTYFANSHFSLPVLYLSSVLMVVHVCLSRLLTPLMIGDKYLNVNLSHELWKDIEIGFLQISKDNPPAQVYLSRLLLRWLGFNCLVFVFLSNVSRLTFGDIETCTWQ